MEGHAGDQGVGVGIGGEFLGGQQVGHVDALGLGFIEQAHRPLPHLVAL